MQMQDYIDQCSRLISKFSNQSYPKNYLNYCWILWKDLDVIDLKNLVDKMIEEDRPQCLSIESAKVWNVKLRSMKKKDGEEQGYEFLMKKYKCKNIFELVQAMKDKDEVNP